MAVNETNLINDLRQALYPVFQTNGVARAVAYQNKERITSSVDSDIILMVESGLKGIDFCELLDEIHSAVDNEYLNVLDVQHFKQWSEVDNELALEGTEIYYKEPTKNKNNYVYIKEIRDTILKVQRYCDTDSFEMFEGNSMLTEACEYNLRQISKLADHVEAQFKSDNPQVPWTALRGFQWKLTSTLPGANKVLLWEIIQNGFPEVLGKLEYVLATEMPGEEAEDSK